MFLESRISLLVALLLVVIGCFQSLSSRKYSAAAVREVATTGKLTYVLGGRQPVYDFEFERNGYKTSGESRSCHTALSWDGCKVGAPVRVYYDPEQIVETTLQEYGDLSRQKLFFGVCMVLGGILLATMHLVLIRMEGGSQKSEGSDENSTRDDSEALHVTPGE